MADTRANFKLFKPNWNIYYLNKAAILQYGGLARFLNQW